jgi:hypothetical protein
VPHLSRRMTGVAFSFGFLIWNFIEPESGSTTYSYDTLNRHDDVAHQGETVAITHLAMNRDESISGANRPQKGQTSIASEGNEMQMAASIVANEFIGHGTEQKSKRRK